MAQPIVPKNYVSPLPVGNFDFQPVAFVLAEYIESWKDIVTVNTQRYYDLKIFKGTDLSNPIASTHKEEDPNTGNSGEDNGIRMTLEGENRYTADYKYRQTYPIREIEVQFEFQVVTNQYPIAKVTLKGVIDKILELAEPLNYDATAQDYVRKPRFHFEYKTQKGEPGAASERKLFKKTSPEFALSRMTLREQLQEVGKFIHAEPRLKSISSGEIIFDQYGGQEYATYTPYAQTVRAQEQKALDDILDKPLPYDIKYTEKEGFVIVPQPVEPIEESFSGADQPKARVSESTAKINFDCYIGGTETTGKKYIPSYPFIFENVLDATLDSATLQITRADKEVFEPLTEVTVVLKGQNVPPVYTYWVIAEDFSEESPVGSGKYNHTLSLIEPTKYLEGFICDSITVTHKGGNVYTDNAYPVEPKVIE